MNNEETIIKQPKNNEKANETQNSSNIETGKKSGMGKKVAVTAGAAALGGVAGAGGMFAASKIHDKKETEEPDVKETDKKEDPVAFASEPKETHTQPKQSMASKEESHVVSNDNQESSEYNQHQESSHVRTNPDVHQTVNSNNSASGTRVVSVDQIEIGNGHTVEAVTLTNDGEVAVVVDTDNDGTADILAIDENRNGQFEDNELHDISGENWQMSGYEQAYAQQNPVQQHTSPQQMNSSNSHDTNEVQVLGVYQAEGSEGQTMEAAVLTNGQEIAAVVDVDGDGYAEALVVDQNQNQQIEEGEVYDISSEQVQMSGYEQNYLTQQQEAESIQQEHDSGIYNTTDEQTDYTNDMNLTAL